MPSEQTISISGFYRNDQEGGLDLTIRAKDLPDSTGLDEIAQRISRLQQKWREHHADPIDIASALSLLAAESRDNGELSQGMTVLALSYIAYLQSIDAIPTDEYNGIVHELSVEPPTRHLFNT